MKDDRTAKIPEPAPAHKNCLKGNRVEPDDEQLGLQGCRKFTMRSLETGLEYEIFVYVPDAPPPPSGFPVLYVLDANSDFVTVAETVRRVSRRPLATGIGASIVVGIGYPNTKNYDLDRRYLDFTRGLATCTSASDVSISRCGGQSAYIRFLSQQLLPHISSQFAAHPDHRVMLGHSLAGYFVLDVMAQYPDLFDGYISFSPSIWWDQPGLSDALRRKKETRRARRVYIAAGRYEQELAPWQARENFSTDYHEVRAARRMIDNARDVAKEIEVAFGRSVQVRFEIGDQEDHSTIVTTLLCRALRFASAANQ